MLKYLDTAIVFKEVPDEISLAINLTNCPNKCKGCHSPQLQEDIGMPLTEDVLKRLIEKNKGITCVLFLGGDNDIQSLYYLMEVTKKTGFKTAWYSGRCELPEYLGLVDYIKIGPYKEELGGLDRKSTNQIFFKVVKKSDNEYVLQDQTYLFQK